MCSPCVRQIVSCNSLLVLLHWACSLCGEAVGVSLWPNICSRSQRWGCPSADGPLGAHLEERIGWASLANFDWSAADECVNGGSWLCTRVAGEWLRDLFCWLLWRGRNSLGEKTSLTGTLAYAVNIWLWLKFFRGGNAGFSRTLNYFHCLTVWVFLCILCFL